MHRRKTASFASGSDVGGDDALQPTSKGVRPLGSAGAAPASSTFKASAAMKNIFATTPILDPNTQESTDIFSSEDLHEPIEGFIAPSRFRSKYLFDRQLTGLLCIQRIRAHHDGGFTNGAIWAMETSPDGVFLATAGSSGTVKIWKMRRIMSRGAKEGEPFRPFLDFPEQRLSGHSGEVMSLSWSKSNYLLSASKDRTVRLWHASSDKEMRCFTHPDGVHVAQFHPEEENVFISGGMDGVVRLFFITNQRLLSSARTDDIITALNISSDGRFALVGTYQGRVFIYTLANEKNEWRLQASTVIDTKYMNSPRRKISGISLSPDEQFFCISCCDSTFRVYRADTAELDCTYVGQQNNYSQFTARFSHDGARLMTCSEDGSIVVFPNYTVMGMSDMLGASKKIYQRLVTDKKCHSHEYFKPFEKANVTRALFGNKRNNNLIIAASNNGEIAVFKNA